MTAYIDNIIIVGTPEEIQEFIELRKGKEGNANTPHWMDVTYWGGYEPGQTPNTNPDGSITISSTDINSGTKDMVLTSEMILNIQN